MTPSPSPTPTSSPSSCAASSPTNTALHDVPRDTPVLPPISQISLQPGFIPPPRYMGAPRPSGLTSATITSTSYTKLPSHGKQKSDESVGPSSPETSPQVMDEDDPGEPEQGAGPSAAASSSPNQPKQQGKKKRTRTLTTPHQSAVLHALLVQSRFPTTAMREEVGRSIGLSARKVQVWFQNQRQKARKPRSQSSAPVDRPPQFGPFTSGPSSTEAGPVPGPSGVTGSFQSVDSVGRVSPYVSEASSGSIQPRGPPASNPSISLHSQYPTPEFLEYAPHHPGPGPYPRGMLHGVESVPLTRGGASGFHPPPAFLPPQSPPYASHSPYPHDTYPHNLSSGPSMRPHSPIVLPPLRLDQPRGSQFQGPLPPPPLHALDPHFHPDLRRSASFPSVSPSEISSNSSSHLHSPFSASHHGEAIPPPFTLQPAPQWDLPHPGARPIPALYPPVGPSRSPFPQAYTRHRTNSDPTRTLPPLSIQTEQERPLITQPWPLPSLHSESSRSAGVGAPARRFDPVHSVVSERQRDSSRVAEAERNGGPSRNRHSYDFGRPSGSMSVVSPSREPDEADRQVPQGSGGRHYRHSPNNEG